MLLVNLPQAGSNDILYARISGVAAAGPVASDSRRLSPSEAGSLRGSTRLSDGFTGPLGSVAREGPLAQLARAHA
jgi:hypothetical protein